MTFNKNIEGTPPESALKFSWWLKLIMILLMAAILILPNWSTIRSQIFETGDAAANSLLIQDAKSFKLLVGNYSRIGFNHPGPAILYVLAAGEILFYDTFKLAVSPVGGQLIAVGIYNAFWLIAILALFVRIAGSKSVGFLSLALFVYATNLIDVQFLTGMWFPHLYFLPFAVMLLAASRLVSGHTDNWITLAVSSGFLIHGHVSFVAIIGIIFIVAIAFNHTQSRAYKETALLSNSYLRTNIRNVLYFIGIGFIFLLPIVIETILRFPGPIADYASFGGLHKPNSATKALRFVSYYWGGGPGMFAGMALLAALVVYTKNETHDFRRNVKSLVALLFSATFALWFYARYGVDNLDYKYIGLFYYSVPILTLVLAVIVTLRRVSIPFKTPILVLLCALLSFGAYKEIHRLASPGLYGQEVADLYHALNAIERSGRLVLDMNRGPRHSEIWPTMVGVLAYAKRQHNNFICINQNWHIMYTHPNKCTPDEVAGGKHFLVSHFDDASEMTDKPYLRIGVFSIFAQALPQVIGQGPISISNHSHWFNGFFLQSGWSSIEKDFVWSQEREARLLIPIQSGFSGQLTLDLAAYLPTPESRQKVDVRINGAKRPPIIFSAGQNRQEITFDIDRSADKLLNVNLHIENPFSPRDFGSGDRRTLGVSLYGFQIK
jgi:hypothetical protein